MLKRSDSAVHVNAGGGGVSSSRECAFHCAEHRPQELRERLVKDLRAANVLKDDKSAPNLIMGQLPVSARCRHGGVVGMRCAVACVHVCLAAAGAAGAA